jgi:hypothetical protein
MLKFEFKEPAEVLLMLATLAVGIALLGTNPLDTPNPLNMWVRIAFGVLGCGFLVGLLVSARHSYRTELPVQPTADYSARFEATQKMIANLTPDRRILADKQIGRANFVVLNEDIVRANADVVVSSDDNHFTARGGVAKAIRDKLGPEAQKELDYFRQHRFRQGQLAITTGGNWGRRAVIHPAVIDLDENRYPRAETIRRLTRQSLISHVQGV